jgi:predicted transcriptional regulator of viral defense system
MKGAPKGHLRAREFLDRIVARGRSSFTAADAFKVLGVSHSAAAMALSRMSRQKRIVSPARGFYLILPPEYRDAGCLPADLFVPDLMEHLKLPYYAGVLTAAQYHGAAHQQPMEFQVFVEKPRRTIVCGRVRVVFIVRRDLARVPVQRLNTRQGYLTISTPEATALDLIGYPHHAAGFSNAIAVLSELSERLKPKKLAVAAASAPPAWAQRLGFVLDHIGAADKTPALKNFVRTHARKIVPLLPGKPHSTTSRDAAWRVYANADVEIDT